jgi:hypothetical protein
MTDVTDDKASISKRVSRLANERTALFTHAGASTGRSAAAQTRLVAIERELDECYMALRTQRAARDARRFSHEDLRNRRPIDPRPRA